MKFLLELEIEESFASLNDPSGFSEESIYRDHAKHDGAKQRHPEVVLEESFTTFTTLRVLVVHHAVGLEHRCRNTSPHRNSASMF
jgi:hypothetical protein